MKKKWVIQAEQEPGVFVRYPCPYPSRATAQSALDTAALQGANGWTIDEKGIPRNSYGLALSVTEE